MTNKSVKGSKRDGADREMDLTDHLAELRTRIMRSIGYMLVGMTVTWIFYSQILGMLQAPIQSIRGSTEWRMIFTSFMEPFFLRLQVSAVAALILTFPLLLTEAWGFIAPALTRSERRAFYFVGPLCVLLFLLGVASAFFVMPRGIAWFLGFLPRDTELMQRLNDYVVFLIKSSLAFGVVFQLPVVMLFLGKVGIVNSRFLVKYWRQAIVVAAGVAAIVTPSADAFTMVAMTAPLIVLYALSIILVKFVEHPDKGEAGDTDEE